jgi:hypothetical protein
MSEDDEDDFAAAAHIDIGRDVAELLNVSLSHFQFMELQRSAWRLRGGWRRRTGVDV